MFKRWFEAQLCSHGYHDWDNVSEDRPYCVVDDTKLRSRVVKCVRCEKLAVVFQIFEGSWKRICLK